MSVTIRSVVVTLVLATLSVFDAHPTVAETLMRRVVSGQTLNNVVPPGSVCPAPMLSSDMQALGRSVIATERQYWETTSPLSLRDSFGIADKTDADGMPADGAQVFIPPLRLASKLWEDMWAAASERNAQYLTKSMQASLDSRHFFLLFVCFPDLKDLFSLARQRVSPESIRAAEEAEQRSRQQTEAERSRPENVLLRTYQEYIFVKKCHDEREGYLAVTISDQELDKARQAAHGIEQKLTEKDTSIDKDALWKKANENGFDGDRNRTTCQLAYEDLKSDYGNLVPESNVVKKDF